MQENEEKRLLKQSNRNFADGNFIGYEESEKFIQDILMRNKNTIREEFEKWCAMNCIIPSPARWEAWQAVTAQEQAHADMLAEALRYYERLEPEGFMAKEALKQHKERRGEKV